MCSAFEVFYEHDYRPHQRSLLSCLFVPTLLSVVLHMVLRKGRNPTGYKTSTETANNLNLNSKGQTEKYETKAPFVAILIFTQYFSLRRKGLSFRDVLPRHGPVHIV